MNAQKVTSAKPKVGGAIYSASYGTELPKNAIDELSSEFKGLGYISEEGLVNENSPESEQIMSWGGDVVASLQTGKEDRFTYKLIEALNVNVLKQVYGNDNVDGDLETGIKIKANNKEHIEHVVVIDMILKGDVFKRIVIPAGKVAEVGEIEYTDDDVVGYEVTIDAIPFDDEGNTHFEYIQKKTKTGDEGEATTQNKQTATKSGDKI